MFRNRRMKWLLGALMLSLIGAILVGGCRGAAPATGPAPTVTVTTTATVTSVPKPEVIKWVGQVGYAGTEWGTPGGWAYFLADWVKRISQGRLIIEVKPPESVLPTLELFNGVKQGLVDLAIVYFPGFHAGVMPEALIQQGIPMTWQNESEAVEAWERYGLKQKFAELYAQHNILLIPVVTAYLNVLTTFPIDHPDDLKGKKMRATGVHGDFVKQFGASPVTIPSVEQYTALQLGTIDGAVADVATLESLKLKEIIKYVVYPPVNFPNTGTFINLNSFKRLPEDLRALVVEGFEPFMTWYGHGVNVFYEKAVASAESKYGLKRVFWSGADMERARAAGFALWDGLAAKSPASAELIEMLKKQQRDLGRMK